MAAQNITHITSPAEHDAVVSDSETKPTAIYLSNSTTPVCKAFAAKYEGIVAQYTDSGIRFCLMEFNNTTSMMFKFAPNQLPVVVFMCEGPWCRSVVGATVKDLEAGIKQLLKQVGREPGESSGRPS